MDKVCGLLQPQPSICPVSSDKLPLHLVNGMFMSGYSPGSFRPFHTYLGLSQVPTAQGPGGDIANLLSCGTEVLHHNMVRVTLPH